MNNLVDVLEKYPGFKISDSHFKIGSKLHVSDFYYAKRIFQNSFFANRFAFLVTKSIVEDIDKKVLDNAIQKGLSLIGYGIYSELLLSLVERFLKSSLQADDEKINHVIVIDDDQAELPANERLLDYGIIIVPIASTFSTALKIEAIVKTASKTIQILTPHFNILHVSASPQSLAINEVEKDFGWTGKDTEKKIVNVKPFDGWGGDKPQRYFLSLLTSWQRIDKCMDCYPIQGINEYLEREKPLFEAERSAVSPNIIFNYPKGRSRREYAESYQEFKLMPDMIRYGRYSKNNSHFIYSFDTQAFLKHNRREVNDWLAGKVSRSSFFSSEGNQHKYTIIISACHRSNTSFINAVNKELFQSSANIIHYEAENDHIQNFLMAYAYDIRMAERIVYVDDVLKSGETFGRINDFVQFALKDTVNDELPRKGIHAAVIMINETNAFTNDIIKGKLIDSGAIFSFANLNLFYALNNQNKLLPSIEKNKYDALINDSFLDSLKLYFSEYYAKIQAKEGKAEHEGEYENYSRLVNEEKHVSMIQAVHSIYEFFGTNTVVDFEQMSFDHFTTQLIKTVTIPKFNPKLVSGIGRYDAFRIALLKAFTQFHFSQYEPVRKVVFRWILKLFTDHIEQMKLSILNGKLSIDDFNWFKFLVRRSVLINSNFILSKKVVEFIGVFADKGMPLLEKAALDQWGLLNFGGLGDSDQARGAREHFMRQLREFHVFFPAQIKELLAKNEVRSIRLENIIRSTLSKHIPVYKQIVRVLGAENAVVIKRFVEYISLQQKWKELPLDVIQSEELSGQTDPIKAILNQESVRKHLRFQNLNRFFVDLINQPAPEINNPFVNFLWLQLLFQNDDRLHQWPITTKWEKIFGKVGQIMQESAPNIVSHVGAFLIIRDIQGTPQIIYDKNQQGVPEIEGREWDSEDNSYLMNFVDGVHQQGLPYNKTLVELKKGDTDERWKDLYAVNPAEDYPAGLRKEILPGDINRLILMRLSDRNLDGQEKTQGVVGIYFQSDARDVTDANRIRFLLLLKEAFAKFIDKHHLNNEYLELLASTHIKKLALLSGHGRDMLKALSITRPFPFGEIALSLEHIQMIILFNESLRTYNQPGYESIKDRFDLFYNVRGHSMLDAAYMGTLKAMAEDIFNAPEIEIDTDCDVLLDEGPADFSFAFNQKVLNLIMFELFLNAKKNRWHFLPDEEIGAFSRNRLEISASVQVAHTGRRLLHLTVKNTCPWNDKDTLINLNSRYTHVKPNDIIAGSSLLKALIYKILDGNVQYHIVDIDKNKQFCFFVVKLILNEMI